MEKIKLYTEEQVIKVVNKAFWQDVGNASNAKELMSGLTPIELPSDEEIDEQLQNGMEGNYVSGFYDGVDWLIEQIKQQVIP